jgi:hypothetical protein
MITKIARALLLVFIVFVAAVYIPKFYWMKFEKSVKSSFVLYSPILKDFLFSVYSTDELRFSDRKGRLYDRDRYEALTPLFNYRQLLASGKMPDSLNGVKLNVEAVRMNNFSKKIRPADIDLSLIPLNPLLESKSGRVRLEMPEDFFRIDKRMEFINCATNTIDAEKSEKFTKALQAVNFAFPAKMIAGNPTTKKAFDEGYFVVDSQNKMFHIKMVKGEPFCVDTKIPANLDIVYLSIAEMQLREFYGMMVTRDNSVYLISYNNYKLIRLPVSGYNYKESTIQMMGDLFYRIISVIDNKSNRTYVTDRRYNLIDSMETKWEDKYAQPAGKALGYLVPFAVTLTQSTSSFVRPVVVCSPLSSFILTGILLIITFVIYFRQKASFGSTWFDYLLILLTGVYGFIAVMLIKRIE